MSGQQSLVSIVVPTHNSAEYLRQCLDSIIGQTYRRLQIICVDDGSTDETVQILDSYAKADSRLSYVTQENRGAGVARNRGLDQATGDYLLFFDSDDWMADDLVQCAVSRAEECEADIVVFPIVEAFGTSELLRETPWLILEDKFPQDVFSWRDNPDWIFRALQNYPWNKLLKMSLVRENDLRYQEIFLTEDLMFMAPAFVCARRICLLRQNVVYHRVGISTNVMSFKDAHPLDFYTAFRELKSWLEKSGYFDELKVAYTNWAIIACKYNLDTLNGFETFSMVYEKIRDEIINELGLDSLQEDEYQSPECLEFLRTMRDGTSPAEYLMGLLRTIDVDCMRLQFVDSHMHYQAERLNSRIDELSGEVKRLCDEAEARKKDLTSARREAEELRRSTSFRLGNTMLRPLTRLRGLQGAWRRHEGRA